MKHRKRLIFYRTIAEKRLEELSLRSKFPALPPVSWGRNSWCLGLIARMTGQPNQNTSNSVDKMALQAKAVIW